MSAPGENLRINGDRLWDSLMDMARTGPGVAGGNNRQTLTDADGEGRHLFKRWCEAAGLSVSVDQMGTMFATRPGTDPQALPVYIGSHLDTQPTGGKFDGVLGVLAGLEVLRTLHDAGYETTAPLELVNWTNEEGARFAPAMLASGVFAGLFDRAYADAREDRDGKRFGDELERIGYRGSEKAGGHRLGAMFELHIEQGPVLEAEGRMVGAVTGVQGARWYEITIAGEAAHTGATPMHLRKNALLGAAALIQAVNGIGEAHLPGVATVGLMEVRPNSRNVVPGEVFLCVDLRHPDDTVLDAMEHALRAALPKVLDPFGLAFEETRIWHSPSVKFDPEMIACVREGAAKAGFESRDIVSGAGHDAVHAARICPTTMIFVPCEGGISHNESESTSPEECAAGAQVLLNAVLAYDARKAEARDA
jgi:N-carbamoyl-L-amino-acid hydrolase